MAERTGIVARLDEYLRPHGANIERERLINAVLVGLVGVSATLAISFGLVVWVLLGFPMTLVTWMLGEKCVSVQQLDCVRAVGDARQAVLFTAGGMIAVVGLYFTYKRWMLEHKRTALAEDEGRVIEDRHRREGEQLEIGRITDALSLLESENEAKQMAGISLLTDYAIHTPEERHVQVILDVLKAFIERDERDGWRIEDGERTDDRLAISPEAAAALRGLLRASSTRCMNVELKNLTFRELQAPGSDWRYVRLEAVNFSRSNLAGARFGAEAGEYFKVKFETTDLTSADFTGINMRHGSFYLEDPLNPNSSAALMGTKFDGARLQVVSFHGGYLFEVSFAQAKLTSVTFAEGCSASPKGFVGANLMSVSFPVDEHDGRYALVSDRGQFQMRGHISPTLVTGYVELLDSGQPSGPQPARDSGETAGDSHTPKPNPTDEPAT